MSEKAPSYPQEWLAIARRDWQRVQIGLANQDAPMGGFFLQQCLEKYLKAWLLARGWALRRTHELDVLLEDAIPFDPGLDKFRGLCERLSGYYMLERYPPLSGQSLGMTALRQDLPEARSFIRALHPEEAL